MVTSAAIKLERLASTAINVAIAEGKHCVPLTAGRHYKVALMCVTRSTRIAVLRLVPELLRTLSYMV